MTPEAPAACVGTAEQGFATRTYAELERALSAGSSSPTLTEVAVTVRQLRANKSMVLDPSDPNTRSAGSFFTNPILSTADAQAACQRAVDAGIAARAEDVPSYDAGEGKTKLAAGWLIEKAGFEKGLHRGSVGISSKHALSLVHLGGGTTERLLRLAREVRDGVEERFGVTLQPEPTMWGVEL